uniref:Uncharacterized protein n=1 Tax=Glossina palpalis gambiensis TaxID=67801 RepID=A0A1B0BDQ9_9MUSC
GVNTSTKLAELRERCNPGSTNISARRGFVGIALAIIAAVGCQSLILANELMEHVRIRSVLKIWISLQLKLMYYFSLILERSFNKTKITVILSCESPCLANSIKCFGMSSNDCSLSSRPL